jgi:hypothetical protein
MDTTTPPLPNSNADPTPPTPAAEPEGIPLYDRLVLWMFLVGFILFGVILGGDMVAGFFR